MAVTIEPRPYGPNSTPEEIDAIRARMRWLEPGIIIWNELPVLSLFSVELATGKLSELLANSEAVGMLVDLTEAESPPPDVRNKLMAYYKGHPKIRCFAVYNGKNFLSNVFARLMGAFIGLPITFHKTYEGALAALKGT